MFRTTRLTALALAGMATIALTACGGSAPSDEAAASQTNAMYTWISNENDRAQ